MQRSGPLYEIEGCAVREVGTGLTQHIVFGSGDRLSGDYTAERPDGAIACIRWFLDPSNPMPRNAELLASEADFWGACGDIRAAQWVFARMLGNPEMAPSDVHPRVLRDEAVLWKQDPVSLLVDGDPLFLAYHMKVPRFGRDIVRVADIPIGIDSAEDILMNEAVVASPASKPLPEWIARMNLTGLALCGGAALYLATGFMGGPTDWDFFACEGSWEPAKRAVDDICSTVDPSKLLISATSKAVSVFIFDEAQEEPPLRLQFIRREFPDIGAVFDTFDLDCCCVGYYQGQLVASRRGERALRTMCNTLSAPLQWGRSSVFRVTKYALRGFSFAVPGLRWARMDPFPLKDPSLVDSLLRQLRTFAANGKIDGGDTSYESSYGRDIALAYSAYRRTSIIEALELIPRMFVQFCSRASDLGPILERIKPSFSRLAESDAAFFAQPRGDGRDGGTSFQTLRYNGTRYMYVHEDAVGELAECEWSKYGDKIVWKNPRYPDQPPMQLALRIVEMKSRALHHGIVFSHPALSHVARVMSSNLPDDIGTWSPASSGELIYGHERDLQNVVLVPAITFFRSAVTASMRVWRAWGVLVGA